MTRRSAASVGALLCSIALAAAPAASASAPSSTATKVYTQHDSGRTVSTTTGTTFKVRLRACGDCGDSWRFATLPAKKVVHYVGSSVRTTAKPPAVGGEEIETWTFTTTGKGKTSIVLAEHSAEKSGKVIKRFQLTVKVSKPTN